MNSANVKNTAINKRIFEQYGYANPTDHFESVSTRGSVGIQTPSPYPEDYPYRDKYIGVNIYTNTPNRYPYMYDRQTFPGLYYPDTDPQTGFPMKTPKVFPYTNRPWRESTIYTTPVAYESLLDDLNLRPAYTFYKRNMY